MKYDIHYLLTGKYSQWIVISLISLFGLLIIIEYASLFFIAKHTSVPSHKIIEHKTDASDEIERSSLFGIYVPDDMNGENVTASLLDVTVVGILLSDKTGQSQVIIRSANGSEKTYKINDKIGEAIIKRIMPKSIVVERNGSLESLSLPKNDLIFEPVAKPLKEEE